MSKKSYSKKAYTNVINFDNKFIATSQDPGTLTQLPPGCYEIGQSMKEWWFQSMDLKFDTILNLPSPEFQFVTKQFSNFLKPEIKAQFEKYGFLYKRSVLLHGAWGTGKSVIINRIAKEVIDDYNGVCLFLDQPGKIKVAFEVLDSLQPDTPTVVILEELDEMIRHHERELLVLLDGAVQKNNVMFLAATNYLNKIPKRILRPGRFGLVVEVHYPNTEARTMYFNTKLGSDHPRIEEFVLACDGLSVDELKEIIMYCIIFENNLNSTIKRIKDTRGSGVEDHTYDEDEEEDEGGVLYNGN